MALLIVLLGLLLLLVLIVKKISPMLALLIVSIITGLLLGMSPGKVMTTIASGIGSTLGSMVMVLALGAMLGKLIEESGSSKKIVFILIRLFGIRNIQWAILLTGLLVGIPLFYNAGFVVLVLYDAFAFIIPGFANGCFIVSYSWFSSPSSRSIGHSIYI
jgi:H+/gluconate symporter-like permease